MDKEITNDTMMRCNTQNLLFSFISNSNFIYGDNNHKESIWKHADYCYQHLNHFVNIAKKIWLCSDTYVVEIGVPRTG